MAAVVVSSCGGSPTASTPQFPNMVGTWTGTRSLANSYEDGSRRNGTCTEQWTITSQDAGLFSGTFRSGGGDLDTCQSQSGSVSGSLTSEGRMMAFTIVVSDGISSCRTMAQSSFFATVSGRSLQASWSDQILCSVQGTVYSVSRSITMELTKS